MDNTDFQDPAAVATTDLINQFAETFNQDGNTIERNSTDNFRGNESSRFTETGQDMESSINFDSLLDQMAPNPGDDIVLNEPDELRAPTNCPPGQTYTEVQCFTTPCPPGICVPMEIVGGPEPEENSGFYPGSLGAQRSIPAAERTPTSTPLLNWDAKNLGDRLNQLMKDQGRTLSEARAQNESAIGKGADLNGDGFVTNREWYNFTNE